MTKQDRTYTLCCVLPSSESTRMRKATTTWWKTCTRQQNFENSFSLLIDVASIQARVHVLICTYVYINRIRTTRPIRMQRKYVLIKMYNFQSTKNHCCSHREIQSFLLNAESFCVARVSLSTMRTFVAFDNQLPKNNHLTQLLMANGEFVRNAVATKMKVIIFDLEIPTHSASLRFDITSRWWPEFEELSMSSYNVTFIALTRRVECRECGANSHRIQLFQFRRRSYKTCSFYSVEQTSNTH